MFFQTAFSDPLSLWIKQLHVKHRLSPCTVEKKSNRFCSEGNSMCVIGFAPCSLPFSTGQSVGMLVQQPHRMFDSRRLNIIKIN